MQMHKLSFSLLLPLILVSCSTLKTPTFTTKQGAIRGYDPVAYHTTGQATPGNPEISMRYNGATWNFSSEQNLKTFRQDPVRYAPQYGGYCAYGMSQNYVVSVDPEAWHIDDGKLYLNYSQGVRKTWLKDIPGHVSKADKNWTVKIENQDFE